VSPDEHLGADLASLRLGDVSTWIGRSPMKNTCELIIPVCHHHLEDKAGDPRPWLRRFLGARMAWAKYEASKTIALADLPDGAGVVEVTHESLRLCKDGLRLAHIPSDHVIVEQGALQVVDERRDPFGQLLSVTTEPFFLLGGLLEQGTDALRTLSLAERHGGTFDGWDVSGGPGLRWSEPDEGAG
jgi:hypothetical protein